MVVLDNTKYSVPYNDYGLLNYLIAALESDARNKRVDSLSNLILTLIESRVANGNQYPESQPKTLIFFFMQKMLNGPSAPLTDV